jgi:hypothetical protein
MEDEWCICPEMESIGWWGREGARGGIYVHMESCLSAFTYETQMKGDWRFLEGPSSWGIAYWANRAIGSGLSTSIGPDLSLGSYLYISMRTEQEWDMQ